VGVQSVADVYGSSDDLRILHHIGSFRILIRLLREVYLEFRDLCALIQEYDQTVRQNMDGAQYCHAADSRCIAVVPYMPALIG
jgi:hypothetical protein